MPNPIKYSTGSETNALKKGNFYIGTGSEGKGPSDVTGYYNGVTPQTGGYVIYMFKDGAPGNLSYHSAANNSELISFTSGLAGQTYTGVSQCFDYYAGQTDKVMIIQEFPSDYPLNYPNIVMPGLVLNLDAGITQSYPGSGTTWTDINGLGQNNNGTLINGPTFNSDNGGSINFDGIDEIVSINITNANHLKIENFLFSNRTIEVWFNLTTLTPSLIDNTEVIQALITWPGFHNGIFISRDTPTSTVNLTTNYLWNSNRSTSFNTNTPLTGSNSNIITTNTWFCVHDIIDYSSTKCFTYVNGVNINTRNEVPTSSMTSSSGTPPNVINIGGARNTSTYRWFVQNGNCGSVRLYNRALSATEVLQNYNATKGRFGL